jgi:hypothetical protein
MSSEPDVDWDMFESVNEDFDSEDWLFLLSQDELLESEILEDTPILLDIPAAVLEDIGQNNEDWLDFLLHFPSAKGYNSRVLHFLEWKMLNIEGDDIITCLKRYFWHHHDAKKTVEGIEKNVHAPTVFRGWFSMFCKFWKVTGKGNLRDKCPALYESFTDWETGYTQKHAHEFTKEDMLRFHMEAPDDDLYLLVKAYSICATAYGARSSETHDMPFEYKCANTGREIGIKLLPDGTFSIKYDRNKVRGLKTGKDQHCLIEGELETKCLQKYWNTFLDSSKKLPGEDNRFFRKLLLDKKTTKLVASKQHIGKNTTARYGILIATFLGLDFPKSYTGQCWRGTACTYLADAGFSKIQIQQITGHKSEKAIDRYVANSVIVKKSAAVALSLTGCTRPLPTTSTDDVQKKRRISKQTMFNFTINTTDSAKCSIHIGKDDESTSACDDESV